MLSWELTFVIIAAVLALFTWIGVRSGRSTGDVEDYVVARDSQGARPLALSFIASGLGAWVLFAVPEVGAFVGLVGIVGYALAVAAPVFAFALIGPRMRQAVPRGHTLTEFVGARFGRPFQVYVIGISILYMFFFVTAELTAVGAVTAILSGLDARVTVLAVAAATVAYTAVGGLRASLRTDGWQAWLIVALVALVAVAVIASLVDPGEAFAGSGLVGVEFARVEVAVTLIVAVTAANLFHQGYWQRVWAARDDASLARAGLAGGLVSIPIVLVIGILGIVAAGAPLELGAPPVPFFALVTNAPAWVGAVVLVLGVALVASSVDTLVNGMTALVAAEHRRISLPQARSVTVLLLLPGIAIAWQGYSVLRLFLMADLLCAATVVPVLLGLWRRSTTTAAFAGALAGLAGAVVPNWIGTGSFIEAMRLATFPNAVPTLMPFAGALLASTFAALAVSLILRQSADIGATGGRIKPLPEPEP
ncbi:MAG: sodium:solute symporter [Dehalococcoidia bacterium]|nr:sodium:solute symporter [Dehalococcoidia bacterium]